MKITISKLLILLALVLAVPAIGGRAVFAQGADGLEISSTSTKVAQAGNDGGNDGGNGGNDGGNDGGNGGNDGGNDGGNGGGNTEAGSTSAAKDAICDGIALTGEDCDTDADKGGLDNIVKQAINILSVIIGIICVIMIMIGGLKYITSGGDANSLTSAKNTILYALVGLVVVAFAQTIVRYVLSWL